VKLFEEYINADNDLENIITQLKKRIEYWFTKGEFSVRASKLGSSSSSTASASKKSIIVDFTDDKHYYQMIIRISIEDMDNCDFILKKYDMDSGDEIDTLNLVGEDQPKVDDIKEEFIIDKIREFQEKNKNPDENEIKQPQPKKKETTPQNVPPQGGQVPPTGQVPPPPQGGQVPPTGQVPPPTQGGGGQVPPPQGGASQFQL
jgi:hypothetical protein